MYHVKETRGGMDVLLHEFLTSILGSDGDVFIL